jgi:hypothetical protein
MKNLQDIKDIIESLSPAMWIRLGETSITWDKKLNELMEHHKFALVDKFTAKLGDFEIWYRNHPYGSFGLYYKGKSELLPKRLTVIRAYRKLITDIAPFSTDIAPLTAEQKVQSVIEEIENKNK